MDSQSWLTYQLESVKKATQKEELENILFSNFSKSGFLVLAKVFYIIFLYYCVFSSGVCRKWTDLPGPCASPEQRGPSPRPQAHGGPRSPHNYAATLFPSRHLGGSTTAPSSLLPGKAPVSFVCQHHQESTHHGLLLCACFLLLSSLGRTPRSSYCQHSHAACVSQPVYTFGTATSSSLLHTHQGLEGKPPSSC